jgi:shikimate dehydrogenase
MGHPVAHSKSPFIHASFAAQTGEQLHYEAICVEPGSFAEAVAAFQEAGGRGLNVTLPFKEEAFAIADVVSERAAQAGAANTLLFDAAGKRHADNTDGIGLTRDLQDNHGIQIKGRRVLLLGAGGAARGVVAPLLAANPLSLVIANRTHQRAVELAGRFRASGPVSALAMGALGGHSFDVLINATSASLNNQVPDISTSLVAQGGCCYDMMYAAEPTPFIRWARDSAAAHSVDGAGMLVEQAAEAFYLWRGVRPRTREVIVALRGQLQGTPPGGSPGAAG